MYIISDLIKRRRQKYLRRGIQRAIDKMDHDTAQVAERFGAAPLTADEHRQLIDYWHRYFTFAPGDDYYRLAKRVTGTFDPRYVSDSMFYTHVLYQLNDRNEAHLLEDKNLYGFYYDDIDRPIEVVRNVRGLWYDAQGKLIDQAEAVRAAVDYAAPIIVKPTCDSEQGHGVERIEGYDRDTIERLMARMGENFVMQEAVEQSPEIAAFNPTSLNTIRVHTLLLNGRLSILRAALRCGAAGSIVDNAGAGGMMVGIDPERGTLSDYGINKQGQTFDTSHTGVRLSGYTLHSFERVRELALTLHSRVPFIRYAGWDIAVRRDGTPTFIELNASSPGIFVIQLCTGPIFGDRLDEVLHFTQPRVALPR